MEPLSEFRIPHLRPSYRLATATRSWRLRRIPCRCILWWQLDKKMPPGSVMRCLGNLVSQSHCEPSQMPESSKTPPRHPESSNHPESPKHHIGELCIFFHQTTSSDIQQVSGMRCGALGGVSHPHTHLLHGTHLFLAQATSTKFRWVPGLSYINTLLLPS